MKSGREKNHRIQEFRYILDSSKPDEFSGVRYLSQLDLVTPGWSSIPYLPGHNWLPFIEHPFFFLTPNPPSPSLAIFPSKVDHDEDKQTGKWITGRVSRDGVRLAMETKIKGKIRFMKGND
ncbi:hypothetical protein E2C01_094114 [Portunus trituberculatus]|uniref:Uncharacterized protein n=1 Tax=Portunus trituberculatus TaxID=210409 RepID=A0A5B7JWB3_PORTR|nr:hypothetical protein [Portunus trituberculatus]